MKLSAAEQESLVALLNRLYSDICAIEQQFNLLVGEGDFRPRIEYFHDAIRAFFSQDAAMEGRLSVELLAYDLSCLRYIHSKPLSGFKPHSDIMSPATAVLKMGTQNLSVSTKRPDRAVRERISELYQGYGVLFAALLKPCADRDYHDRTDHLNQDVEDIQSLIKSFQAGNAEDIGAAIMHLEDHELRNALVQFTHNKQHKKKDETAKLMQSLKLQVSKKDKEIKAIDNAHMNYALAQLGIFEGSKDMLKSMAKQGMNLVGKFVEASIAEAKHDRGR